MDLRIALAGNPNCGKTTLFNALTGSSQFVGNWPGVTVEKKEGKLKGYEGVIVTDLPGIYSLSPYTLEEVVARNYLVGERPDAILNLVDGTNIERNLYLTTQLTELGIPVVVAINMMDVVRKNGDEIDVQKLSRKLGCRVVEISALKEDGLKAAVEAAIDAAQNDKTIPMHSFSGAVEHAIAHIEEAAVHNMPPEQQRWYAIKIFERDERALAQIDLPAETLAHIETDIVAAETELDDDAEGIIANERYVYIANVLRSCYRKNNPEKLSSSEKIDKIVTNRFLALPIFALIMFLVYYISVVSVGTWVTDFTNDGLFGEGFYLFGKGREEYELDMKNYSGSMEIIENFITYAEKQGLDVDEIKSVLESDSADPDVIKNALVSLDEKIADDVVVEWNVTDEETFEIQKRSATGVELTGAIWGAYRYDYAEPQMSDYGWWCHGIPVLVEMGLDKLGTADWLRALVIDGIVAGVGAVLGFVPQIFVLFIFLAFLEACGYMSRIAFMLDKIFRKFGLSGKSFIPLLIGSGCGVPGIMASRTIENESDRRMTIMTTTFIPCGAKLPIIAMITASVFGGAWWLAPVCYFSGIAAVIISGIMLKKTKAFASDPAPFVMELPAYRMPTLINLLRSMWERGWSFIKKAGTVILLSTIIIWAGTVFGTVDGKFVFSLSLGEEGTTILDYIGKAIGWLFVPLGFSHPSTAVATVMGLVAKEEVVAVLGITAFAEMSAISALSFLMFNLLCAPCFAAMGAIRREMNSGKWTAFAIGYQCAFAYSISLMIYNFGSVINGTFTPGLQTVWLALALLCLLGMLFMLFRPRYKAKKV